MTRKAYNFEDLAWSQKALYVFRLFWLALSVPILWLEYRRAQKRIGSRDPYILREEVMLRLGHNARKERLDALRPKQMAKKIYRLRHKRDRKHDETTEKTGDDE